MLSNRGFFSEGPASSIVRSMEHMWPEVNQRINYPVKRILVQMEGSDEIDMSNDIIKFCVSWTTISVIRPAIVAFLSAWNSHRIPGVCGGIPNTLASQAFEVTQLPGVVIPTTAEAICLHRDQGGTLTEEHGYGTDPLTGFQAITRTRFLPKISRYGGYISKCFTP